MKGRVGGFKEWNENETAVSDEKARELRSFPKDSHKPHKKCERDAPINNPGKPQKLRGYPLLINIE